MKTIKLSILAFLFGIVSLNAQTAKSTPINSTVKTAASQIAWKSETIDLGEIPQGTPKPVEFAFKNTGKTDVIITNVKASCGCTAADYTKTPVKPGESAKVTATYNAASAGAFTKTLTVTTNVDESPKVLTLKGIVK